MNESRFLAILLPSHPDFLPIEKAIREKYSLSEISPDDEPITEVYLGDEIIPGIHAVVPKVMLREAKPLGGLRRPSSRIH